MKKKFIKFLKDNNAYYAFVCNLCKGSTETLSQYIYRRVPNYYFISAFDWDDGKKGDKYWNNLDDKWNIYLNTH